MRVTIAATVVVAVVGAVTACWLATTLAVAPIASTLGFDSAYKPMWCPANVLWPLGRLPDPHCPTSDPSCVMPRSWLMVDFTDGYPATLTMITIFVMAYAIGAAREAALARAPA